MFLTSGADAAGSGNTLGEPPTRPVICKLSNFPSAESSLLNEPLCKRLMYQTVEREATRAIKYFKEQGPLRDTHPSLLAAADLMPLEIPRALHENRCLGQSTVLGEEEDSSP